MMQITGTRDVEHDLISLAQHAPHGAGQYGTFEADAVASGDCNCVELFRKAQSVNGELEDEAQKH